MNMINEYLEWGRSIEPMWAGFVVWFTALSVVVVATAATAVAAIWLVFELVDRMGLWVLMSLPAFIAYCFYIAVFAQ